MKKKLYFVAAFFIFLVISFIFYICGRKAHTTPIHGANPIAVIEKMKIGGIDQYIMFRGHDRDKPVLLIFHGGPGMPYIGYSKKLTGDLEKHFVVASWEQRGAGKSYSKEIDPGSMNIDQFVSDAVEITEYVRKKFNVEKVHLWAQSWGSIVGVLAASRRPDLYFTYVGVGQNANIFESEMLLYDFLLKRAQEEKNDDDIAILKEMQPPPYDDLEKLRIRTELLNRYGHPFDGELESLLYSYFWGEPEYSPCDIPHIMEALYFSQMHLLNRKEVWEINFPVQAPELKVPVIFISGRHDRLVNSSVSEKYFNILRAPSKKLIWFENSGHFFMHEENQKFQEILIRELSSEKKSN